MNFPPMSAIAAGEIRAHLGRRRESVRSLADATGIAESTLKRRLLGTSPFTLSELDAIAHHFGVSLVSLLDVRDEVA